MSYPYELVRVPGTEAIKTLLDLRLQRAGTPVILGDESGFERVAEWREMNSGSTPEELIEIALTIDAEQWLADREADEPGYYGPAPSPWPVADVSPNTSLSAHLDVRGREPYAQVVITVLPASEPWMAPCFLKIGNWNEMPGGAEHAALFKYWSEKFGATVACMANDVIEMTVERPASTRDEALALAKQQFVYCPDIVYQGVESVEALAATLLGATVWYFWWD